jgi:hypothetical protein
MSTYTEGPSIAELDAEMNKYHAQIDARLVTCSKLITKLEARHQKADKQQKKAKILLDNFKVISIAPQVALAAEKLLATELKLRVTEYELKRKTDECKRLASKHLETSKSEIRVKKEKKQLAKTVDTLTTQLKGKITPEEIEIMIQNKELEQELTMLRAQLNRKIEECETKDRFIADLTVDFAAYQNVTSDTWVHRHDSCNELNAALDEQCAMLAAERDALQSKLNALQNRGDFKSNFTIFQDKVDVSFPFSFAS